MQIRRARATSTAWSATTTAPTPTRWWRTGGSTRSWTPSWPRASRSSPPPSTAPPRAAATTASRPTTTAGEGLLVTSGLKTPGYFAYFVRFLYFCPFNAHFSQLFAWMSVLQYEGLKVGRLRDFNLISKLSIYKITILLSGNASTLCWGCPRWKHTSTDTWMSSSVQSPARVRTTGPATRRPRRDPPAESASSWRGESRARQLGTNWWGQHSI